MNVEYTLVRELQPYAGNARTHSRKQIRQIANSIKRFSFNNPVLVVARRSFDIRTRLARRSQLHVTTES